MVYLIGWLSVHEYWALAAELLRQLFVVNPQSMSSIYVLIRALLSVPLLTLIRIAYLMSFDFDCASAVRVMFLSF